jgi:hypothetical protein
MHQSLPCLDLTQAKAMTQQHRVTSHTTVRIKDLTYEASNNGGPSDIITNICCVYTYCM